MSDSLDLKDVELDYEAEEAEDQVETPTPRGDNDTPGLEPRTEADTPDTGERQEPEEGQEGEGDKSEPRDEDSISQTSLPDVDVSTDLINSPAQAGELGEDLEDGEEKDDDGEVDDKKEEELEEGEELEDGEISDEDEALKNERLEPKPVCRFFSKGQCTWGASCRFLHPGVLDKGNYSMFAAPRPILPGETSAEAEAKTKEAAKEPVLVSPAVPEHESAWERGMRQAKEMRRRSNKRREMDVEYEEKKTSQSLTQVELDKENDYYMRPASPAHTHDPYAEDDYNDRDPYDTYHPESVRRVAPPPPPDFIAREERERSRYHEPREPHYPPPGHGGPPRPRRIAPPRDPSPHHHHGPPRGGRVAPPPPAHHGHGPPPGHGPPGGRFRGGEDWADPWMRGGGDRGKGAGPGGRGPPGAERGRRRSYSSGSSRSSSGSSRSRSPRRRRRYSSSYSSRSSSRSRSRSSTPAGIPRRETGSRVKKEAGGLGGGRSTAPLQKRLAGVTQRSEGKRTSRDDKHRKSRGDSSDDERSRNKSGGPGSSRGEKSKELAAKREKFKMNMPNNQLKLNLKGSGSSKTADNEIFEKATGDEPPKKSLKRKLEDSDPAARQQQKLASMKSKIDAISKSADKIKTEKSGDEMKKKLLKAASAAGVGAGDESADAKGRREELLKQLRAVEEAIHKKRSKLDK